MIVITVLPTGVKSWRIAIMCVCGGGGGGECGRALQYLHVSELLNWKCFLLLFLKYYSLYSVKYGILRTVGNRGWLDNTFIDKSMFDHWKLYTLAC